MELFNIWSEDSEDVLFVKETMVRRLEEEMETMGDIPAHPVGRSAAELTALYRGNGEVAQKGKEEQRNI